MAVGTITRYIITCGLLVFIVLAVIPGLQSYAVAATLLTPILAATCAGFELMKDKKVGAGISMIFAVALAISALIFGVAG